MWTIMTQFLITYAYKLIFIPLDYISLELWLVVNVCIIRLATLPTWTIIDLVWEIDMSFEDQCGTLTGENVCIIQAPFPHEPSWKSLEDDS